ncbi:peptidase C14 caspase catalytic subunit p20 [Thalassoporum mexicanum PCC 7367]|uniref:caspase family protein n=1 Tax=Thalassoporum mexicanum TaxID=3457544 RepID=UPI00029FFF26|nr:caspase family protein [Pseudanabaena sp. PCC 7367]AFY69296.1 peptidase C14 caspase catalytic subunit p20 [Pseudanabaena sp. PCC 7367]
MKFARRQFLQSIFASWLGWQFGAQYGDGQFDHLAWAADRYALNLARPTKRKLALLIGINQYNAKNTWLPLNGCVTDVDLQRELLIHRFGFNPADIVTLIDGEATGAAIAEAFEAHLIAQAKRGDVVVVHFSGHGSRLGGQNTILPVNSTLPKSDSSEAADISIETLSLWLRSIATENVTVIMDAGFHNPGSATVGNYRIRARPSPTQWQANGQDQKLQERLRDKLQQVAIAAMITDQADQLGENKSKNKSKNKNQDLNQPSPKATQKLKLPPIPGIVLYAAQQDQLCADALWQGFSSGIFTYALTQQLWQMTPATSLKIVLANVVSTLEQKAFQPGEIVLEKQIDTHLEGKKSLQKSLPTYLGGNSDLLRRPSNQAGNSMQGADGVVRSVVSSHKSGEIWLAGLPIAAIGNYGVGSVLAATAIPTANPIQIIGKDKQADLVQVKSLSGLSARVELLDSNKKLQAGQLLQEEIRALPRSQKLTIAIDAQLNKIERIDATSAISALPNMSSSLATEQFADCLFGAQADSYGLFTPGLQPIMGTFGTVDESVGAAIRRLQEHLEGLLAIKLLRMTANQGSSSLGLKMTMQAIKGKDTKPTTLVSRTPGRYQKGNSSSIDSISKPLAVGDRLACHLKNLTDDTLYVRIFCFDPRAKVLTHSFVSSPYASDSVLAAGSTLVIPQPQAPFNWLVSAPKGLMDVMVVASRSPLTETTDLLEKSLRQATSPTGMLAIPAPLDVAQAVLRDLQVASLPALEAVGISESDDLWQLCVHDWVTLGFSYHVA